MIGAEFHDPHAAQRPPLPEQLASHLTAQGVMSIHGPEHFQSTVRPRSLQGMLPNCLGMLNSRHRVVKDKCLAPQLQQLPMSQNVTTRQLLKIDLPLHINHVYCDHLRILRPCFSEEIALTAEKIGHLISDIMWPQRR